MLGAVDRAGSSLTQERDDLEALAQHLADERIACRFTDLEVVALGLNSALASVTWELLRTDESIISAWRESYNLMRTGDGFLIFASIDHVG